MAVRSYLRSTKDDQEEFRGMKNNPTTQNIERIKEAKIVQVIEVLLNRGNGTENDPIRSIRQYYDFEGNLLVDLDDWKNE